MTRAGILSTWNISECCIVVEKLVQNYGILNGGDSAVWYGMVNVNLYSAIITKPLMHYLPTAVVDCNSSSAVVVVVALRNINYTSISIVRNNLSINQSINQVKYFEWPK